MFRKYFGPTSLGVNEIVVDGKSYFTTDFSFQISMGIRNYAEWRNKKLFVTKNIVSNNLEFKNLTQNDVTKILRTYKPSPIVSRGGHE